MNRPKRPDNRDMRPLVQSRTLFENHNRTVFSRIVADRYVVYSYGEHFPMFVWEPAGNRWFGNHDRYSPTTNRHKTLCAPIPNEEIAWFGTAELMYIAEHGYTALVAAIMTGENKLPMPRRTA